MTLTEGRQKSRSLRRITKRTPSGKLVMHYLKRTPKRAECAGCGKALPGVPRATSSEFQNMPLSHKRPSRPFGGKLCSPCMRKAIVEKFRNVFTLSKSN